MNLYTRIADKISKSLVDHLGKVSAGTISSYFILAQIMLMGTVYLAMDVVNAFIMWRKDELYTIPSQSIFILGLVLSHHLVLLGIKKAGDTAMYPTGYKTTETTTTSDGATKTRDVQIGDIKSAATTPVAPDEDSSVNVDVDVDTAMDTEYASDDTSACTCHEDSTTRPTQKRNHRD